MRLSPAPQADLDDDVELVDGRRGVVGGVDLDRYKVILHSRYVRGPRFEDQVVEVTLDQIRRVVKFGLFSTPDETPM